MSLEARSPAILRFGVFEADLRVGEVRKPGVRTTDWVLERSTVSP